MSHFTVLVAARNREELEALLLPYHEYECTGIEEYLEWVDKTDEGRNLFENEMEPFVKLPGGEIRSKYDDAFYVETPPRSDDPFRMKRSEFRLPEGAEIVEMTRAEAGLETFEEFVQDYYGAKPIPGKPGRWGRLTNPNAKWDGWQVGGRWTGTLRLKPRKLLLLRGNTEVAGLNRNEVDFLVNLYLTKPAKFNEVVAKYEGRTDEIRSAVAQIAEGPKEDVFVRPEGAENGTPGLLTEPNTDPERADSALAGDVDWDAILQGQIDRKMNTYAVFRDALDKARLSVSLDGEKARAAETWAQRDACRAAFKSLEDWTLCCLADRLSGLHLFETFGFYADLFYKGEDEYRAAFKGQALTWAFVDGEGRWVERAEMGWWGLHGDVDGDYDAAFWKFVRSLDASQRVWIVDCHI